jgi:hypothetical protein
MFTLYFDFGSGSYWDVFFFFRDIRSLYAVALQLNHLFLFYLQYATFISSVVPRAVEPS